jgi:hypothetical protein
VLKEAAILVEAIDDVDAIRAVMRSRNSPR